MRLLLQIENGRDCELMRNGFIYGETEPASWIFPRLEMAGRNPLSGCPDVKNHRHLEY
jgi:hypothetical protein